MEIIRAELIHLGDAAFLFDQYRQFYQQKSDVEGVLQFLEERIRNNESIIFLAYAEDKPVGFMQLYPTFSSISIQRAWVLNDLFVDVDYRHSGVGSALLDAASAYEKKQTRNIWCGKPAVKISPQRLYESKQWKKDTDLFYRFELG